MAGTSTIKFSFKREWEDQRLLFHSERELSPEEKDKIWLPWTIFSNLRDRKAWVDTDKLDLYKVKLRNDNNPEEVIRNRSHHMVIEYEREKIIEFMCDYDMFWYPFDRQSCGVEFYQRDEQIILLPKSIAYKGPIKLEQYTVDGVFLCSVALQVRLKNHSCIPIQIPGRALRSRSCVPTVPPTDEQRPHHLLADHHPGHHHPPRQRLLQRLPARRHSSQSHSTTRSCNLVSKRKHYL